MTCLATRGVLQVFLLMGVAQASFSDIDFATFASGNTGFKFLGGAVNDNVANVLSPAKDFNGDGMQDMLLVSNAPAKVYVLFGRMGSSPFPTLRTGNFTTSDTNGFVIYNVEATHGITASSVGDFNSDGFSDIAVGSPSVDYSGRTDVGVVFIIFGRSSGIADININTWVTSASTGIRIYGEKQYDHFGARIVNLGDFNGDGKNDFVVWAVYGDNVVEGGNNDYGVSYVIFGDSARITDIDMLTGNGFAYGTKGFRSNTYWGLNTYPAACGDFNNDGYADLALPSSTADTANGHWSGAVWILFGHSTATTFADIYLNAFPHGTGGFLVIGAYEGDNLGTSVAPGGDFNGDGLNDMIIGAYGSTFGKAYVLFGRKGVASYTALDLRTWPSSVNKGQLLRSSTGGFEAIYSVSNLGDLNGDGITDVIIAAVNRFSNTGWAGVFFGHRNTTAYNDILIDTFTANSQGFKMIAPHSTAALGGTVVGLGDVNGDGYPDLMISANWATVGSLSKAGAAYVVYGQGPPTASPTARPTTPTSQPSSQPSAQPSHLPSAQPTSQPSTQPSTQPSVNPDALQSILASPTYKVRNGFAFAAVGTDGKAQAWGEAAYGGDASAVQSQLQSGVAAVVGSRFAFAALKTGGSLELWGVNVSIAGLPRYGSMTYSVTAFVATEASFAGVDTATGRVIAVGSKHHGGNVLDNAYCNGYSAQLSSGVRSITASHGAFAAIKTDSTLLCWGNKHAGADVGSGVLSALVGAKLVVATMSAFAVLLSDYTVATWGDRWTGGDSSAVAGQLREVHHFTASRSCFVAFKKDSGVVVWGYGKYGGDTSAVAASLSAHVVQVAHTFTAMAALKVDGTVVAWGEADAGGDASTVQAGLHAISRIYGNGKAFAALTSTGGVVAWGSPAHGGSIPSDKVTALSGGVVSIAHTDRAFAALKSDGSVVVWGQAGHGGSPGAAVEALLTSGVHTICANDVAFSVIKTDGSVVAWGHSVSVPTAGVQFTSSSLAAGAQCA